MARTRLPQLATLVCLLVGFSASPSLAQTFDRAICAADASARALFACDRALNADRTDHLSYLSRANLWAGLQEPDRALMDFDASIRLNPSNPAAYLGRGLIFHIKEKYAAAVGEFSTAIQLNANSSAAYHARGETWMASGDLDKALSDFTEAIRLDPQNARAYVSRGGAFIQKRQYDLALGDLGEAIRRNPLFLSAYMKRATAFESKGELASAISDYTQAIKIEPSAWLAYQGRARLFEKEQNFEQALADLTRAKALAPSAADLEDSFARLNRAMSPASEISAAESQIRLLLNLLPKNPLANVSNEFLAQCIAITIIVLLAAYLLSRRKRKMTPVERPVVHDFLATAPASLSLSQPKLQLDPFVASPAFPGSTNDNLDTFQMVVSFFPNVQTEYDHMACYGEEAQRAFIEQLSSTRLFQTPEPVREEIIRGVLVSRFGFDEMVQNFGRYLLETGNYDAADYLSRLVAVLGDMAPAEKLIADTEQKMLALRTAEMQMFNQNSQSASSRRSKTYALSGAMVLVACGVALYVFRDEVHRVTSAWFVF